MSAGDMVTLHAGISGFGSGYGVQGFRVEGLA